MIYRAIKKRNGDIYICPAQLENVIENPLTAEQQLIVELDDRVTELEQELSKLKESQTQKSIIKLCNRVDKAEADKAELVEFVKEMNDLGKLSPMRLSDYTDVIYHESLALLNKHTDKHDALQALKKDHPEFGGKK